jgi:hypothetical protein
VSVTGSHVYTLSVKATAGGTGQLNATVSAATPDPVSTNDHSLLTVSL